MKQFKTIRNLTLRVLWGLFRDLKLARMLICIERCVPTRGVWAF